MHSERTRVSYTLYHGTVVHTPSLGQLLIQPKMLIGVTQEGKIDYFSHYGEQEHALHKTPQAFFQWLCDQRGYGPPQPTSDRNRWEHYIPGRGNGGNDRSRRYGYDYVDFSKHPSKFLVPGFFDTHIHASQFPNAGLGSELPLLDWLEKYTFSLENRFRAPDGEELPSARKRRLQMANTIYSRVINRTLAAGTTTASYFATIDTDTTNVLADLAVQHGQRALVGKVCMDCNPTYPEYVEPDAEALVRGTVEVLEHCAGLNVSVQSLGGPKMVQGIVTPRFAPLCLGELMKRLGALASKYNAPVQTHISENKDEIKLVADLFPECSDYTGVYDDHGLLGALTILAHAVHLTKHECKKILQKNCSILHCPSLNTFLTSGTAPVKRYLYEDKINVALGTDISGGCDYSILSAMKELIMVLHHLKMDKGKDKQQLVDTAPDNGLVTVADALYMATMGGAVACDMGSELGSFEVNKWFDAQLIDVMSPDLNIDVFDFQEPALDDTDMVDKVRQLVHRWIFCGDDRNCVKVWCNGRQVVDKEDRWVYLG
ncbi:hypothetical protein PUMCH_001466 [Australozyma saopauloensis]|uniref:Amidohydrolase-related domain-containing protein n=1 Tax=Australozyma saopauloensis TaxID=291208 RepID=A0AAX4H7I8_9ASCO|nr:hypothetical protein PUMCH_001466 [[Candida] saopauloensis]